ncbi:hypothetical protein [Celeribacter sp.]|uniref:hypothetical protein n=1 Tax=Celeribacter sp. TaxID=1890673 RepID=UPI003A8E7357
MLTLLRIAALVLFSFPAATAAEQLGTVSIIWDGEAQDWFTISDDSGDALIAWASLKNGERLSSISIQAHPNPRFSSKNILSISLTYLGAFEPDTPPNEAEFIYTTNGMRPPFYTSAGAPIAPTVTIEGYEATQQDGQLTGTFSATLCLAKDLYGDVDTNDCKDLSGSFSTGILLR